MMWGHNLLILSTVNLISFMICLQSLFLVNMIILIRMLMDNLYDKFVRSIIQLQIRLSTQKER